MSILLTGIGYTDKPWTDKPWIDKPWTDKPWTRQTLDTTNPKTTKLILLDSLLQEIA
jgi:hypothetical protein